MTKKIMLALAVLASSFSYAQEAQNAPVANYGLLGQRYAQFGFGGVDVKHSTIDSYGAGATFNAPVTSNIDVNLAYSYQWVEGNSDVNGHALDLTGVYYITDGNLKPFGFASLGYVWPDLGDELTWGAGAGVEYVFNSKFSANLRGEYADNFKSGNDGSFAGTVGGNYWLNNQWALNADVTWFERGSVGYTVSAIFKF